MSTKTKSAVKEKSTAKNRKMRNRNASRNNTLTRERKDDGSPEVAITNDVQWYLNNPTLTRDTGNIWFSKRLGSLYNPSAGHQGISFASTSDVNGVSYGGIMAISTIQHWGSATGDNSQTLNQIAMSLYQYVVHANSRNTSYQKSDLMKLLMAVDGLYQLISEAVRTYRLHATFSPVNKFYSKIIEVSGWNAANVRSNLAQFRYYINDAITRVNMLMVPSMFDITKAHINAYSNIYMDAESGKANIYVTKPIGYWCYKDETGYLTYEVDGYRNGGGITPLLWYEEFLTAFNAIANSEYMGIMQGDLLKAFGPEKMAKFVYVGVDESLYPIYDPEFLFKLHNASFPYAEKTEFDESQFTQGVYPILTAMSSTDNTHIRVRYGDDAKASGNMVGGMWIPKTEVSGSYAKYWDINSFISSSQAAGSGFAAIDLLPGMVADPATISLACADKYTPAADMRLDLTGMDGFQYYVAGFYAGYEMYLGFTVYYWDSDLRYLSFDSSIANALTYYTFEHWLIVQQLHVLWQFRVLPAIYIVTLTEASGKIDCVMSNNDLWDVTDLQDVDIQTLSDIHRVMLMSLFSDSTINTNSRG